MAKTKTKRVNTNKKVVVEETSVETIADVVEEASTVDPEADSSESTLEGITSETVSQEELKDRDIVLSKKKKKEYHLEISLNDKKFECDTDDLAEAILSFAPEFLKTKVIIHVTKGKKTLERVLYLQEGKKLFYNRYTLEALIRNLYF